MYEVTINDTKYQVEIKENKVVVNNTELNVALNKTTSGEYQMILPDKVVYPLVEIDDDPKNLKVTLKGNVYQTSIKDEYDQLLESMGLDQMMGSKQSDLKAPMPGLVLDILAEPGTSIPKGEPLLVLEAMKMENMIKSPMDVVVKEVMVKKGQAVEKNSVLVTFE